MKVNKAEVYDAVEQFYVNGEYSLRDIAERFGVHWTCIQYHAKNVPGYAEAIDRRIVRCRNNLLQFRRAV